MKLNQKGALDFMLIAVFVVVLVAGGFVLSRVNEEDASDSNQASVDTSTQESATDEQESEDSLEGGVDFVDPNKVDTTNWISEDVNTRFSFLRPEVFTTFTKCTNADWTFARYEGSVSPSLDNAGAKSQNIECGGFADILVFSIRAFDTDGYDKALDVSAPTRLEGTSEEFIIDGVIGEKICVSDKTQPFPEGPFTTRECQYNAASDATQIWASYTLIENENNVENIIDAMVGSINFTL